MAEETQIRVVGYKERKEMTDVQKITEILLKELDWEQDLLFGFVGCEERKVACITEKHLENMVTALVRGGIGDTDAIAAHCNALEHRAEVVERALALAAENHRCEGCPSKECDGSIRGTQKCRDTVALLYIVQAEQELVEDEQ